MNPLAPSPVAEFIILRMTSNIGRPEASKEKYSGPVITRRVQYGQQHKKIKNKKKKILRML